VLSIRWQTTSNPGPRRPSLWSTGAEPVEEVEPVVARRRRRRNPDGQAPRRGRARGSRPHLLAHRR
jgi:hypothetical protein